MRTIEWDNLATSDDNYFYPNFVWLRNLKLWLELERIWLEVFMYCTGLFLWFTKLEEGSRVEHLQAQRCRARLDHLESADAENLSEWNNMRLKRILVDYMLRMSYYDTAVKLAESSNMQVCFQLWVGDPAYLNSLWYDFVIVLYNERATLLL